MNLKGKSIEVPFAKLCSGVSRFLQRSRKVAVSGILLIDDSAIFRKTVKSVRDFNAQVRNIKSGEPVLIFAQRGQNTFFAAFELP